jgi:hypothetical protein
MFGYSEGVLIYQKEALEVANRGHPEPCEFPEIPLNPADKEAHSVHLGSPQSEPWFAIGPQYEFHD